MPTDLTVVAIETPTLGDRSYLVHDGEVALVVDPQRDIDRVLDLATKIVPEAEQDRVREAIHSARQTRRLQRIDRHSNCGPVNASFASTTAAG